MTAVSRGNSEYLYGHLALTRTSKYFPQTYNSIIEGTRESLGRLGLSYVDIIFAHRHDHNGMHDVAPCLCSAHMTLNCLAVPMEEIVRAFNYVIDQGWVSFDGGPYLWALLLILQFRRRTIGVPLNGVREKLKKRIVWFLAHHWLCHTDFFCRCCHETSSYSPYC